MYPPITCSSLRPLALLCLCGLVVPSLLRGQTTESTEPSRAELTSHQQTLLDKAADYSASLSGRAVLVLHRGQLVFERYDDGWTANRPHMLASGSKSFVGVIAMLAVQDQLISLDELASDTLTEWKDDPKKSKITIRHLLTLTSGLAPADAAFPNRNQALGSRNPILRQRQERIERQDSEDRLRNLSTGNWYHDAIQVPSRYEPGERFEYGPSHFYAFGELLNRKLASQSKIEADSIETYARKRLFQPLGIKIGYWSKDKAGNVNLPGGLFLTARDWSKFGQFVLDQGKTTGPDGISQELLKSELLEECFIPSPANTNYGLTWWLDGNREEADSGMPPSRGNSRVDRANLRQQALNAEAEVRLETDGKPLRVMMAAGLGKQRLYVIPDRQLVIVRFAEPTAEGRDFQNQAFLEPIVEAFFEN